MALLGLVEATHLGHQPSFFEERFSVVRPFLQHLVAEGYPLLPLFELVVASGHVHQQGVLQLFLHYMQSGLVGKIETDECVHIDQHGLLEFHLGVQPVALELHDIHPLISLLPGQFGQLPTQLRHAIAQVHLLLNLFERTTLSQASTQHAECCQGLK